jgi:SAM-dependent methyltransferase
MGYMTTSLDRYSQAFVDFCTPRKKVLEIGAAYGVATLEALKKGATVVANDIDSRHVEILAERAGSLASQLQLNSQAFPNELQFAKAEFDAILICRVAHFFEPADLEKSFQLFHQWLKPRGRLYFVCESPYLKNFSDFIPIYEARRKAGTPYPGFIEDVQAIAPERGKFLPKKMHLLDPEVIASLCQRVGLSIVENQFFARPEFPVDIQLDGRESVGLIAEKRG